MKHTGGEREKESEDEFYKALETSDVYFYPSLDKPQNLNSMNFLVRSVFLYFLSLIFFNRCCSRITHFATSMKL